MLLYLFEWSLLIEVHVPQEVVAIIRVAKGEARECSVKSISSACPKYLCLWYFRSSRLNN